jgi:hypothetical protein
VVSGDELIIATELTGDPADMAWFEPMMARAGQAADLIGASRPASGPDPAPDPAAGSRTMAGSGWRCLIRGTAPRPA